MLRQSVQPACRAAWCVCEPPLCSRQGFICFDSFAARAMTQGGRPPVLHCLCLPQLFARPSDLETVVPAILGVVPLLLTFQCCS